MHYTDFITLRDARKIAAGLRTVDRLEAAALHGLYSDDDIVRVLRATRGGHTLFNNRHAIGAFGIAESPDPQVGLPWLIGTDDMAAGWVVLAREARQVFARLSAPFTVLTNVMLASNTLHRRFIDWLLRPEWSTVDEAAGIVRFYQCVSPSP